MLYDRGHLTARPKFSASALGLKHLASFKFTDIYSYARKTRVEKEDEIWKAIEYWTDRISAFQNLRMF